MKIALNKEDLLRKANSELAQMSWFEEGMELHNPRMTGGMLVMDADGMLDEKGVVRAELIEKFNTFGCSFADRYTLA